MEEDNNEFKEVAQELEGGEGLVQRKDAEGRLCKFGYVKGNKVFQKLEGKVRWIGFVRDNKAYRNVLGGAPIYMGEVIYLN